MLPRNRVLNPAAKSPDHLNPQVKIILIKDPSLSGQVSVPPSWGLNFPKIFFAGEFHMVSRQLIHSPIHQYYSGQSCGKLHDILTFIHGAMQNSMR